MMVRKRQNVAKRDRTTTASTANSPSVTSNASAIDAVEPQVIGQASGQGNGQGSGTLGKALDVLDIIAASPHPLRFTEILARTRQPRATLHRQLTNLVHEDLVKLHEDHTYSAGLRLLKLAARSWSNNSLRSIASPHMEALQAKTGETVHLGMLSGHEVIYIDKLESRQNVRMHSQVGNVSPLYCTGVGKAILASMPRLKSDELVGQLDYQRHTLATCHTPELLAAELDTIRTAKGLAHDREEHEPGIYCVAHGIVHEPSGTYAGVSATAPAFRLQGDTINAWEGLVRDCALAIEQDWADRLGPRAAQ
ncbi:MAG: IclR family transcriptional regulator [Pseudomonadota bacterium]